jgi:hypothetical protein
MSERIKVILDAVTDKVLSYRPVDKGLAAKRTKRRLRRAAKSQHYPDAESDKRSAASAKQATKAGGLATSVPDIASHGREEQAAAQDEDC